MCIRDRYSSPDEYEPEGTQDLLELCITASKACVNEYKQTLEKKDSADFASDVQQILAEQTETVWEREKAVAAREEEMANKEAEMMQREEELLSLIHIQQTQSIKTTAALQQIQRTFLFQNRKKSFMNM